MRNNRVSVTGLGVVGLPLVLVCTAHRQLIAYDAERQRIAALKTLHHHPCLIFTSESARLADAAFQIVTVPTPINEKPSARPQSLTSRLRKY